MVNAGAVLLGGAVGLGLGGLIPERVRLIVFQIFGLFLVGIGLDMMAKSPNLIVVMTCAILGGALGEALELGKKLESLGDKLKAALGSKNPTFTDGLVSSSIMVCVGAMAIVGSFEEGLGQGRTTIYTKTLIDFFAVAVLASRLGSGVLLSSLPLLIYQGLLTMTAGALQPLLAGPITDCLSATGGLMVMGIGVNMIGFKPAIPISSILPALLLALILPAFLL
ncbi:MAG: DUF554 domain-containing protein, partial [Deltaproteobacteria bacterium]|jgi:uncharacterized membrane protein YqgA involved in biofilm formation|nr:DUF554 domain-containing protein [Deltaproteobacteria bacterium]